jgi:hypothetical protein
MTNCQQVVQRSALTKATAKEPHMLPVSGIEVEYAAVIEGASGVPPDPRVVARLVVASHPAVLARRGIRSYGMSSDAMLSNGARLYELAMS